MVWMLAQPLALMLALMLVPWLRLPVLVPFSTLAKEEGCFLAKIPSHVPVPARARASAARRKSR